MAKPPSSRGKAGARRPGDAARKDEIGTAPAAQLKTARWRIAEAGAAIAAFLLSLGVFLLGGLQNLRGPEIVVLPPEQILLYRDRTSDARPGVMILVAEVGLINTARPDYGDVAVAAVAEIDGVDVRFSYESQVEWALVPAGEEQAPECPVDARCMTPSGAPTDRPQPGIRVLERRRQLLSVPGGSSRSDWMGFALSDCDGEPRLCEQFSDFPGALAALRRADDVAFRITLDFHSDGRKTLECGLEGDQPEDRRAFFDFLEERGWAILRCRDE